MQAAEEMSEHGGGEGQRPGRKPLPPLQNMALHSHLPPVHVAADHEVGRAVSEVDASEITKRVAQL